MNKTLIQMLHQIQIRLVPFLALFLLLALPACQAEEETTLDPADDLTADTTASADMTVAGNVEKINLNTGTEEEFLTIPEVGDRMVGEFMEYRPYVSIQQFRQEMGKYVDDDQIAGYEEYVFVPVQYNESDAATLQQLPGVDATEAEALIAARPYESRDAFMTKLGEYASADDVSSAERYVTAQ